jgi:hypothetical protein
VDKYDIDRASGPDPSVEWRDIPEFPGYRVDRNGGVWSCLNSRGALTDRWRRLHPSDIGHGLLIRLQQKGQRPSRKVHSLVLIAFVGPRPAGLECRHLDGNYRNNRLENIVWGTKAENFADKARHGTVSRLPGVANGRAKLKPPDVIEIRRLGETGMGATAISRQFGVSKSLVQFILQRKLWRHLS